MSRFLFTILGAIVLIQCGPSEPASKKVTVPFLGRWDVTASQGDAGYPLWFELEQVEDGFKGRFQPRGGHSRPMERVSGGRPSDSLQLLRFRTGRACLWPRTWKAPEKPRGRRSRGRLRRLPDSPPDPIWNGEEPVDLLAGGMEGWEGAPWGCSHLETCGRCSGQLRSWSQHLHD